MTINLGTPTTARLEPHITVIGVGGAGCNAVNNMINANLEGVEFVACNTDAQALSLTVAERCVQLGAELTQGLGSGAKPDVGRAAAEEAKDEIMDHLSGSHMAFVTAGMGGGTGTGAAPVIAQYTREAGILTVGVVTKPFGFEGSQRMAVADAGIQELQNFVDTLIVIPNQNLFRVANEKTTFADAFKLADDVLHAGVRGITDLVVVPGLVNLDFADVKAVMEEMGKAMMGTGESDGEKRAVEAAEAAISNPLLEDTPMQGARGMLINVTGGADMTLFEVDEAVNRIKEEVDPNANFIFGSARDDRMEGRMRVSIVATGIDVAADAVRPPRLQVVSAMGREARPSSERDSGGGKAQSGNPRAGESSSRESVQSLSSSGVAGTSRGTTTRPSGPQQREQPRATQSHNQGGSARQSSVEPRTAPSRSAGGAQPALQWMEAPHRGTAPFIAPPPLQSSSYAMPRAVPDRSGDSVVQNPGALRRGSPSLLERMTGLSRKGKVDAPRGEESLDPPIRREPDRVGSHPAPERGFSSVSGASETEPRVDASAPSAPPERVDDDLLEIPAFLRRQDN